MAGKQKARTAAPRNTRKAASSGGGGGGRRSQRGNAPSPSAIRSKARVKTLAVGGASALGFGLLQSYVDVPGIKGIPDSLTYGTATLAIGLLAGSDVLLDIGTGPFFAGLHNIALNGPGSTKVGGEFDQLPEGTGDSVQGEFEDVVSGDFDDL